MVGPGAAEIVWAGSEAAVLVIVGVEIAGPVCVGVEVAGSVCVGFEVVRLGSSTVSDPSLVTPIFLPSSSSSLCQSLSI